MASELSLVTAQKIEFKQKKICTTPSLSRSSTSSSTSTSLRRTSSRADIVRQKHANAQSIRHMMKNYQQETVQKASLGLQHDVETVRESLSALELVLKDMNQHVDSSKRRKSGGTRKSRSSGSLVSLASVNEKPKSKRVSRSTRCRRTSTSMER